LTVQLSPITSTPLPADSPHFAERVSQLPPAEQRRVVAQQFEAILLRQLLGPTLQALPGAGNEIYGYMLTDALAQKLSAGNGLGLASLLERQFAPREPSAATAPSSTVFLSSGMPSADKP
jgi:peptidoglycan hydrolase FlgJ